MNSVSTDQQQSIIGISLLVKLIESYGISPDLILEQAGIKASELNNPKAQITIGQDIDFTRAMINAIDDPELAFKAGQHFRINAFGSIGLAAAACETVEDAIIFFLKYIRLSYTLFDISFFKQDGNAVLRFNDHYPLAELRRFYLERDFSFVMISTRDIFPRSVNETLYKTVSFDFSPEDLDSEEYNARYECAVNFDQAHNEIIFDEEYLTRPLPHANLLTRKILEEHCETQKVELLGPENIIDGIRQYIRDCEDVMPRLEDFAEKLNMTRRTATRKLQAEGFSFQELVAEEVSKKAIHYLQTTNLTVEQTALKLGYSESAGFIRAFKRWTGKVPKEYRG
jgi:AraC-like DNA-binding protein